MVALEERKLRNNSSDFKYSVLELLISSTHPHNIKHILVRPHFSLRKCAVEIRWGWAGKVMQPEQCVGRAVCMCVAHINPPLMKSEAMRGRYR